MAMTGKMLRTNMKVLWLKPKLLELVVNLLPSRGNFAHGLVQRRYETARLIRVHKSSTQVEYTSGPIRQKLASKINGSRTHPQILPLRPPVSEKIEWSSPQVGRRNAEHHCSLLPTGVGCARGVLS
jgi:hypothetical protein